MNNLGDITAENPVLDGIHKPGFPLCRTVFGTPTMVSLMNLRIVWVCLSEHPDGEHIDYIKTKCTIRSNPIL